MTILVDSRVGSGDLVKLLPDGLGQITTLDSGDAAFLGYGPGGQYTMPVGIEVKTISDAVDSLKYGRFGTGQLPKMSQQYKRVYLIIEGEYRSGDAGNLEILQWRGHKPKWYSLGVTYRAFDNWLNTLNEVGRVVVKHSLMRQETANQILDLYLWWTKEYDEHKSLLRFDESQQPLSLIKPSLKRRIASELPGVGWKRSERVAAHFPNVHAMLTAGETEWIQIQGIGKTLAKSIVQAIRSTKNLP